MIFDLDGVLIDSEVTWNDAREQLIAERGGTWRAEAQRAMMGMSSVEWSRYMREKLGVPMSEEAISASVVERLEALYRERLPLIPGARETVTALASRWPLAIASSANRELIGLVLELASLTGCFTAMVSSEEVPRGKPAPDVYLEAARRIGHQPASCVAVEDSANGIRAAAAAGMDVVAIPNRAFAPPHEVLAEAHLVLASIDMLEPALLADLTPPEKGVLMASPSTGASQASHEVTGVITKASKRSVEDTVRRLTSMLEAKGVEVFDVIDHSGEAERVGLELRDTKLVVFGNPKAGTPVMVAAPLAALDLPLKILVWADDGRTCVSYTAPGTLAARYGLSDALEGALAIVGALTDALVEA